MLARTARFPAIKALMSVIFGFATGAPLAGADPRLSGLSFIERTENAVLARAVGRRQEASGDCLGSSGNPARWKVCFTSAADLTLTMETGPRQNRLKDFIHRTAVPKPIIDEIGICPESKQSVLQVMPAATRKAR